MASYVLDSPSSYVIPDKPNDSNKTKPGCWVFWRIKDTYMMQMYANFFLENQQEMIVYKKAAGL